jgi:DNA-binding winged helix-turn-helix (wHTH) protein/TolB-like protein
MTFPKLEFSPHPPSPETIFGEFRLRSDGALFRQAAEIRLPPKELQLLRLMVWSAGRIVSAEQLRKSLWGDVSVSPDSLPRCVSSLRAHLGSQDCIQTIYKRGYRFTIPIALSPLPRRLEPLRPGPPNREPERAIECQFDWEKNRPVEQRLSRPANLPRLAVLPLVPGPGVPPSLGMEIAEATILRLSQARTPAALLLARDSVFALAASGATAHQAGVALDAHLALAGSVTALPTHVRIRTEMIRVADAVELWMEDFLVPRDAGRGVEAEAARRIVGGFRSRWAMHFSGEETAETAPVELQRPASRGQVRRFA